MKLRKIRYLIGEGVRSIWINRLMSLASVGVLVACMLLMGIAIALSVNVDLAMGNLEQQNVVMAYFNDRTSAEMKGGSDGTQSDTSSTASTSSGGTSSSSSKTASTSSDTGEKEDTIPYDSYVIHNEEEALALCEQIRAIDNVASVEYISSEDGLQSILDTMQEAERNYFREWLTEDNPLSASAKITMKDLSKFDETLAQIEALEGIDVTYHQRDIAMKITSIKKAISMAGTAIIGILFLISMVIVANTIRVTMYNRKLEIGIMKAVGATDRFIRFPFIVEGVVIGIISALFSTGLLYFVYSAVMDVIKEALGLGSVVRFMDFIWPSFGVFIAIGTVTGVFGSIIMISRYLRKEGSEFSAL